MYACVPENGGGFFEGVSAPGNATAHLSDPPPTASRFANCSFPALRQVELRGLHSSVLLLRFSPTNRFHAVWERYSVN
jgi:hypothetical protein